jgi:hypothetical protein
MSEEQRPDDGVDPAATPPEEPTQPDAEPPAPGVFLGEDEHDGWAPIRRRPAGPEER